MCKRRREKERGKSNIDIFESLDEKRFVDIYGRGGYRNVKNQEYNSSFKLRGYSLWIFEILRYYGRKVGMAYIYIYS